MVQHWTTISVFPRAEALEAALDAALATHSRLFPFPPSITSCVAALARR